MRNVRDVYCEFQEQLEKDAETLEKKAKKARRKSDYEKVHDIEREIHGINVVLDSCIDCFECGIQALYTSDDTGPETISQRDCPEASV